MPGALPLSLDLLQSARRDVSLAGRLAVAQLSRLTPNLAREQGEAVVELRIHMGADRRVLVEGRIEADLQLVCQRCMQPMTLSVRAHLHLAWVKSEDEAAELPEVYEPLLAPDGRVTLIEMVTDELLLALPLVPRHEDGAGCGKTAKAAKPKRATPAEDRKKPFAALASLKRGR
jgi:uncharacterized protein